MPYLIKCVPCEDGFDLHYDGDICPICSGKGQFWLDDNELDESIIDLVIKADGIVAEIILIHLLNKRRFANY